MQRNFILKKSHFLRKGKSRVFLCDRGLVLQWLINVCLSRFFIGISSQEKKHQCYLVMSRHSFRSKNWWHFYLSLSHSISLSHSFSHSLSRSLTLSLSLSHTHTQKKKNTGGEKNRNSDTNTTHLHTHAHTHTRTHTHTHWKKERPEFGQTKTDVHALKERNDGMWQLIFYFV